MKSISIPVGIDVSKDALVVFINRPKGQKRLSVPNDKAGLETLISVLGDASYTISLEATGRYEALARHTLEEKGYLVKVQNPRQAKRLAEGLGANAKTDKIDAEVLSVTGPICKKTYPRSKLREELGDMSRGIAALTEVRSGFKKRLKVPGLSSEVAEAYRGTIRDLTQRIKELNKKFKSRIKETELYERYKLAQTVLGIGEATARVLVCELAEDLSPWKRKQILAYGGVTPADCSSGKKTKPATVTRHANKHIKAALYMPAITLLHWNPEAKAMYQRVIKQGRTHQEAIMPVMHKIYRQVVAVFLRGSAWTPDPPARP